MVTSKSASILLASLLLVACLKVRGWILMGDLFHRAQYKKMKIRLF